MLAGIALGVASLPGITHAQAPVARLVFQSAETCPDEQAFRSLVVTRLGRTPFDIDAQRVVRVTFEPAGTRFTGTVEFESTRELESASCEDLATTAAMIVAIALDAPAEPDGEQTPGAWRGELSPGALEALEALAQEPPPQPASPPLPPPGPTWRLAIGVDATGAVGTVPSVAFGGALWLSAQRDRLLLQFEAGAMASVSTTDSDLRAVLPLASIVPCIALDPIRLCGVVSLGAMLVRGRRLENPAWTTLFFGSAGVRVGAGWDIGSVHLTAALEAHLPFRQAEFLISGESVWKSSPIGGLLRIGVGYRARRQKEVDDLAPISRRADRDGF